MLKKTGDGNHSILKLLLILSDSSQKRISSLQWVGIKSFWHFFWLNHLNACKMHPVAESVHLTMPWCKGQSHLLYTFQILSFLLGVSTAISFFNWKKMSSGFSRPNVLYARELLKKSQACRTYYLSKSPSTVTSCKHQRGEWWFLFPRLWIWFWTIPCWVRTIHSFSFSVLLEEGQTCASPDDAKPIISVLALLH